MVPGRGHWCHFLPTILGGVVGFVGVGVSAIRADAADGVDLASDHPDGQRTSCGWHNRPRAPLIGGRVILIDCIDRAFAGNVSTDDVDLSTYRGGAYVMQRPGQRRAATPTIFCRIIFF